MGTTKRNISNSSMNHQQSSTPLAGGDMPPDEQPAWTAEADADQLAAPLFMTPTTKPTTAPKVTYRKPMGQEYIRVRPGAEWHGVYGMIRDQRSDMLYVVAPELHGELADELAYYLVVTAVNLQGEVFLWPIPMADSSGRTNPWWESAMEAAGIEPASEGL